MASIIGPFTEHHPDLVLEAKHSAFYEGRRGDINPDELLDVAAYFVGGHGSRGLPMGSALVGMTVEKDDSGWKTWDFVLPPHHEPVVNRTIGQRNVITFTELADEDRTVFAESSIITFSHTSHQKRLEGFRPVNETDYKKLNLVKNALVRWLLEDQPSAVVPYTNIS